VRARFAEVHGPPFVGADLQTVFSLSGKAP
jgi:hypothetical protein